MTSTALSGGATGLLNPMAKPAGKYRFLDVFAGIGGFRFGFEPRGGECVWSCEIDPYARRTYCANHLENDRDIFRDVRDAGPADVPDHEVLIAGFACFARDTMVLTDEGYMPIQEVSSGTRVLTHLGRWKNVTHVMKRENIPTRTIKAQGVPGIVTTDEHPFMTRKLETKQSRKTGTTRTLHEPQWTEAKNLSGETRLGQVLPKPQTDWYTREFWWLVGRYLAPDGFRNERHHTGSGNPANAGEGRVVITCNRKETPEVTECIRAAGYAATLSHGGTADNHIICSSELYRWLETFGQYAHGKRLPRMAMELEKDKARALLEGYLSGDGHKGKTKTGTPQWTAGSTSKALALGIALLAQRAYGVVATVQKYQPREATHTIQGRTVNQRTRWIINIPDVNRSAIVEGKQGWKRVRSNIPTGRTETRLQPLRSG